MIRFRRFRDFARDCLSSHRRAGEKIGGADRGPGRPVMRIGFQSEF